MQPHPHFAETTTLSTILTVLRASAKLLLLTTALGVLAAFTVSFLIQPKWTATVSIQLGQIASPGQAPRLLESQLTAIDRLSLPSLRYQVLTTIGLPSPNNGSGEANLVFNTLRAVPAKGPDVLNLQVSAFSREQATKALQTGFALLDTVHRGLFTPSVERLKAELATTKAKLNAAEVEYDETFHSLKPTSAQSNEASTVRNLMVTNMLTILRSQILELRRQKEDIEQGLEPLRSYPTRVMGEIYVPIHPSTPGKLQFVLAGALVGLMLGAAITLFRQASARRVSR